MLTIFFSDLLPLDNCFCKEGLPVGLTLRTLQMKLIYLGSFSLKVIFMASLNNKNTTIYKLVGSL